MIDTHCHIDQYDNPAALVKECESLEIRTIAVTSLPSHFEAARAHLEGYDFVRPALGFHPLVVAKNLREALKFDRLAPTAQFIGEIGLDGSRSGRASLEKQVEIFSRILQSIRGKRRFVTIHSRQAVSETLECLSEAKMYPVVFHWFSGSKSELMAVLEAGHYISVNPAMTVSSRWGHDILEVPLERILTETDGPYSKVDARRAVPKDVAIVARWLASKFNKPLPEVEGALDAAFRTVQGTRLWPNPL